MGNPVESVVRIRYAHILRLPAVDAAAQGPAAVLICAVIDQPLLAVKAFPAEGLHVDGYPVPRFDVMNLLSRFLDNAHHLMSQNDAGDRLGYCSVFDVQIAGTDRCQSYAYNGIRREL